MGESMVNFFDLKMKYQHLRQKSLRIKNNRHRGSTGRVQVVEVGSRDFPGPVESQQITGTRGNHPPVCAGWRFQE